jgi:hypothetical protein
MVDWVYIVLISRLIFLALVEKRYPAKLPPSPDLGTLHLERAPGCAIRVLSEVSASNPAV